MDSNVTSAADMFSLGLLIIALYNSPHQSPLETHGSASSYKRIFSSSSSVPNQSNNFLSSRPVPKDLVSTVLPGLITRRPAQRMSAREFQDSQYFDNILVSTIRFLDALPAKTPNEKAQFMRGLPRILNQFPKSVLEKKVLPALLEEMKDKDLLSLILQNVFKITDILPSGKRAFTDRVIPKLREVFLDSKAAGADKDTAKEAGLMVLLENMKAVAENSSGKEFKDGTFASMMIPIHHLILVQTSYPSSGLLWNRRHIPSLMHLFVRFPSFSLSSISAPSRMNCSPSLLQSLARLIAWASKSEVLKLSKSCAAEVL